MKTKGGFIITNFIVLKEPLRISILEPFIYKGTITGNIYNRDECIDVHVLWNKYGKCSNYNREDCFIDDESLNSIKQMNHETV